MGNEKFKNMKVSIIKKIGKRCLAHSYINCYFCEDSITNLSKEDFKVSINDKKLIIKKFSYSSFYKGYIIKW